jgi:5-methylcytosine-specific restriction endonuclease McrA
MPRNQCGFKRGSRVRKRVTRRLLRSMLRAANKRITARKSQAASSGRLAGKSAWAQRYRTDMDFRIAEMSKHRAKKLWKHQRIRMSDDGTVTSAILNERSDCTYCGATITPLTATLDHMDPLSMGGIHSACNVTLCCSDCNSRKGRKPFIDWLSSLSTERQEIARSVYERKRRASVLQSQLFTGPLRAGSRRLHKAVANRGDADRGLPDIFEPQGFHIRGPETAVAVGF